MIPGRDASSSTTFRFDRHSPGEGKVNMSLTPRTSIRGLMIIASTVDISSG